MEQGQERGARSRGGVGENSRRKSRHNKAERRAAGSTICCYSKWNKLRIMPRLYVQFLEKVVNGKGKIKPADIRPLCCILRAHFYISKQHKRIHSSRNKCRLHFSFVFRFIFVFIYLNASETKSQRKKGIDVFIWMAEERSAHQRRWRSLLNLCCVVVSALFCVAFKNTTLKYELNIKSVFDVQCSAHKKRVEAALSWINVTVTAGE